MRYYIVPKIGDGLTPITAFRPKYTDPGSLSPTWRVGLVEASDGRYEALDYGFASWMLVALTLSAADDALLVAQPDVVALPTNLDLLVSLGALATVRAALEARGMPGTWVQTTHSYRQIAAFLVRLISFSRVARKMVGRLLALGFTLDSTLAELTVLQRQQLQQAALDMGASSSGVTLNMTFRDVFLLISNQVLPNGEFFPRTLGLVL